MAICGNIDTDRIRPRMPNRLASRNPRHRAKAASAPMTRQESAGAGDDQRVDDVEVNCFSTKMLRK